EGEERETRERHLAWCMGLAEEARASPVSERAARNDGLEAEHDNLRVALAWSLGAGRAAAAVRLTGALSAWWEEHSHIAEGRAALEVALALPDGGKVAPLHRCRALVVAGTLANLQGDTAGAIRHLEEALALARHRCDSQSIGAALNNLAIVARALG